MVSQIKEQSLIDYVQNYLEAFKQWRVYGDGYIVPEKWSNTAARIVTEKYLRRDEKHVARLIARVVGTIAEAGYMNGYYSFKQDAKDFAIRLADAVYNQEFAFNSPVWFNVGVEKRPQVSACFILKVDDSMEDIIEWWSEEARIFKGGSGAGINLSKLRGSNEYISGKGTSSGPVSFMRAADSIAGSIKSGGKTRRAAKMVVLNVDHPDIEEFIWCKAKEEK